MHAKLNVAIASLVLLLAGLVAPVVVAAPVGAQTPDLPPPCACPNVQPTDDGLLGRVRSQVNELNYYVRQPTPCTGVDQDDPTQTVIQGFLRWREPRLDNWLEFLNADTGVAYRLECWAPEAGEFGSFIEVRVFPDINGENLARLAMDEFLLGLPAPQPRLNPEGTTLVNLDTWLSVDNIPSGTLTSPPISVPGVTVVVQATAGGVEWTMGDGTAPFTCAGTGTYGERSCWHYYRRSSAGQADGQFHGTARIVWIGTYTINGHSAGVEIPVPREAPFSIQVAEAQAVIVR